MFVPGAELIKSRGWGGGQGVKRKAVSHSGENESFREGRHPKLSFSMGRWALAILSSDQMHWSTNILHHFQNTLLLLRPHYQGLNLKENPLYQS